MFTVSAAPSLHFSVSPKKITGGQLHHGQGELGSPAGANRSGEARPWSQAGTNPSHTSSHQLGHSSLDATGVIQDHRLLPRHPDTNTLWVTQAPGDPSRVCSPAQQSLPFPCDPTVSLRQDSGHELPSFSRAAEGHSSLHEPSHLPSTREMRQEEQI